MVTGPLPSIRGVELLSDRLIGSREHLRWVSLTPSRSGSDGEFEVSVCGPPVQCRRWDEDC